MTPRRPRIALFATLTVLGALLGADWPQFRGPEGSGVTSEKGFPTTWSDTENIAWKTALPGAGSSCPILIGDRIFLTCYSGYGVDQSQPGEADQLTHHVLCVARSDGRILWDKTHKAQQPETEYKGFMLEHGYASGTPVSDGQAVYAFFGRSGVFAYSVAGEPLWRAEVGQGTHGWGSGTSPILAGNLVIVNASVESGSLVALDKTTGKQVWSVDKIKDSWSTPAVVNLPSGKQELAVSLRGKVLGLDPATGQQLWECEGVPDYVCPAVIAHGDVVYVTGGRRPPMTLAVRAGGRGDVTATHKLWEAKKTPKVATPVFCDGLLCWIDNRGTATCLKADSGEVVYEERMRLAGGGDKVYASLVAAEGKLYGVSRRDGVVVLAAGPSFKQLAHNRLDDSLSNATPALAEGKLYVRTDKYLYCIGK
jgi:outer membrane protein assembly factor BamB